MLRPIIRAIALMAAGIALAAGLASCATSPETPSPIPGAHFRMIETNGIKLRAAEMGQGPLVVLVHGWPESWYSWRHQIPAIAAERLRRLPSRLP